MSSLVGVQSRGPFILTCSEETTIEQELAKEAAILTGFGLGTAFSLLALLIVVIVLVRWFSARILGSRQVAARPAQADPAARDKALAAAIAVTALLAAQVSTKGPGSGDG